MEIFVTQPGAVVALDSPGIPIAFALENWGGYQFFKSIVSGIQIKTKAGVQYLHSLNDLIFVYTFGERLCPIQITGVSFLEQCERLNDRFFVSNHGLEYALAYYLSNRVTSRGGPIGIALGLSTVMYGFLDEGNFGLTDAERGLGQWSFNFTAIPQPSLIDLALG